MQKIISHLFITIIFLSVLLAEHTYASELDKVNISHKKYVLDNGLTLLVHPDADAASVYISMTYKVGSRDEPEGKTGFAHLFEHLMFKR